MLSTIITLLLQNKTPSIGIRTTIPEDMQEKINKWLMDKIWYLKIRDDKSDKGGGGGAINYNLKNPLDQGYFLRPI